MTILTAATNHHHHHHHHYNAFGNKDTRGLKAKKKKNVKRGPVHCCCCRCCCCCCYISSSTKASVEGQLRVSCQIHLSRGSTHPSDIIDLISLTCFLDFIRGRPFTRVLTPDPWQIQPRLVCSQIYIKGNQVWTVRRSLVIWTIH